MDWRSMGIESVSFTCRPELGNGKPFLPLYLGREPLHAGWKVEIWREATPSRVIGADGSD